MKSYVNDDGNRIIQLGKNYHLFIRKNPNRKFIFWNAPGIKKFSGLKYNTRFERYKHPKWCAHWDIEIPGFHWVGDNAKWEIGTQKVHLCRTKWRVPGYTREDIEG